MFNFTHVLNATTKKRYFISSATLITDEGYDESLDGGNLFQIDLQPESVNDEPIFNVDLYVCNDEYAAQLSKNLESGDFQSELSDALIEGKTLIITCEKEV